jgi:hypothetical protein
MAAGLSHVREQSEEIFSLCRPICNCVPSVGVLDDRVWHTNGQYVFDQDAVGQDLSDVSVAGPDRGQRADFSSTGTTPSPVLTK